MSALAAQVVRDREPEPEPLPSCALGPVQRWLRSLIEAERRAGWGKDARQRAAKRVELSVYRLDRLLAAQPTTAVLWDAVDRMASAHGGVTIDEVYRDFAENGPVVPSPAPARTCARPGCSEPASGTCRMKADRGWKDVPSRHCEEHREELARIRESLDAEAKLMADNGGAQRRQSRERKKRKVPTCCNPGCWDERAPGERYCDACQAAGWTEDTYE